MYVPCIFQTKYRLVDSNVRLALVGDHPALGEWTPKKALLADDLGHDDQYEVVAVLPVNTVCHFKWCILDKDFHIIYWESQKQRAFRVEEHMMYIQAPWNKEFTVIPVRDQTGKSSKYKMVPVMFEMNLTKDLKPYQLCLLGNHKSLGSWLLNDGRVADCTKTLGRVTTYLPVGFVIEFKWILKESDDSVAVWEDGPNRTYKVENLTMTVIECDWNGPQTYWICKQSDLQTRQPTNIISDGDSLSRPSQVSILGHPLTFKHCLYVGIASVIGYGLYRMSKKS